MVSPSLFLISFSDFETLGKASVVLRRLEEVKQFMYICLKLQRKLHNSNWRFLHLLFPIKFLFCQLFSQKKTPFTDKHLRNKRRLGIAQKLNFSKRTNVAAKNIVMKPFFNALSKFNALPNKLRVGCLWLFNLFNS